MAILFTLLLESSLASRFFYVHSGISGVGGNDEFTSSSLRAVKRTSNKPLHRSVASVVSTFSNFICCRSMNRGVSSGGTRRTEKWVASDIALAAYRRRMCYDITMSEMVFD